MESAITSICDALGARLGRKKVSRARLCCMPRCIASLMDACEMMDRYGNEPSEAYAYKSADVTHERHMRSAR